MGEMAGAVMAVGSPTGGAGAVQAIGSKAGEAGAFGVGNIIDATGLGALTGTGFNGAATGLSALEKIHKSGGVTDAATDTLKEGFTAGLGGKGTGADADSIMFSNEGMEDFAPDAGSEMFSIDHSGPSAFEQHKNDFFDGLTKNGSSFVVDENGDWDISRSLAKGAGKFVQNKADNIGKKKLLDKNFAEQEMKRMMAQYMGH